MILISLVENYSNPNMTTLSIVVNPGLLVTVGIFLLLFVVKFFSEVKNG